MDEPEPLLPTEEIIAQVLRRSPHIREGDHVAFSRSDVPALALQVSRQLRDNGAFVDGIDRHADNAEVVEVIAASLRPNPDNGVSDFGRHLRVIDVARCVYNALARRECLV